MMSRSDAEISDALLAAGTDPDAIEAVIGIDAVLQSWRRRMRKREIGHRALEELGAGIDLAQLDVLVAIAASPRDFDIAPDEETTVGVIADRLGIDPSRASRLAAEMVSMGYARRTASQTDARRILIELTPAGYDAVDAVRIYRWILLGEMLSSWEPADLRRFAELFARFDAIRPAVGSHSRISSQVEKLAARIAAARRKARQTAPISSSPA